MFGYWVDIKIKDDVHTSALPNLNNFTSEINCATVSKMSKTKYKIRFVYIGVAVCDSAQDKKTVLSFKLIAYNICNVCLKYERFPENGITHIPKD